MSYTGSTNYVGFESFYDRQEDVNVPKTGLKLEKNDRENQEYPSQSNAKSMLLLVCVMPLIALFQ
jgi:hypothetical protein